MKKLAKVLTAGVLSLALFAGIGATKSEASTPTKPIGSAFYKSALVGNYYTVQNYKGQSVNAKTTKVTTLTSYTTNKNFSYGTTTFVDYDKVDTKWVKRTKTATGYFFTPINNGITFNEFIKTKNGMTYNQVLSITGQKLTLENTYTSDGYTSKDYSWEKDSENESIYADFNFENGKLSYKSFYYSEY